MWVAAALTLLCSTTFLSQNNETSFAAATPKSGLDAVRQQLRPVRASATKKLELPAPLRGVPERIVTHTGYTLSFNREHNNPNWVAWELTAEETDGPARRSNLFLPDPALPAPQRVTGDDYKGTGYDRGHMVPAADMKWSSRAMKECFYMSNMCPQHPALNGGSWATLEEACRRWARQEGRVYIVCGPVYKKERRQKSIGSERRITVPAGFFKCVLSTRAGAEKSIGFYYENRGGKQPMHAAAMSVDEVEELTGMDFFVFLDNRLEARLEASHSLKAWK